MIAELVVLAVLVVAATGVHITFKRRRRREQHERLLHALLRSYADKQASREAYTMAVLSQQPWLWVDRPRARA